MIHAYLFATLAVGGFAGVATLTTSLSAAVCPFGRLQEGWQSGAERPKKVVRSIQRPSVTYVTSQATLCRQAGHYYSRHRGSAQSDQSQTATSVTWVL